MGCGKSTLGKMLRNRLNLPWVDLDHFIEEQEKKSIPNIFKEYGESHFRELERKYLKELLNQPTSIISLGGGAVCNDAFWEMYNKEAILVYLKFPVSTLSERLIQSKTKRPIIEGKNFEELESFITKHLMERESYYNRADIIADNIMDKRVRAEWVAKEYLELKESKI